MHYDVGLHLTLFNDISTDRLGSSIALHASCWVSWWVHVQQHSARIAAADAAGHGKHGSVSMLDV
jgi:hypothetical protein